MQGERRFGVRVARFYSGERFPVLYDRQAGGLSDLDAMRYGLSLRGRQFKARSIERHLRSLSHFFEWCHECDGIDWRGRFHSGEGFTEAEVRDLVMYLRHRVVQDPAANQVRIVQPPTLTLRIQDVSAFAVFTTRSALHYADGEDYQRIKASLDHFTVDLMSAAPAGSAGSRKGLPPKLLARLAEIIQPESPDNPWPQKLRVRNYCMVVLMLDYGLRLSEVCRLKLTDLVLVGASPLVNVRDDRNDPDDPRKDLPEAKTQPRCLPLTRDAAFQLVQYESSWRPTSLLARKSPFIFLSQEEAPISRRTVQSVVERLVQRFPEFQQKLTAHVLRRCFNNKFRRALRNSGLERALIEEIQRYASGWSPLSTMPNEYSREEIETNAHSIMMRLHQQAGH